MRAALNELATVAPDWLRRVAPVEWYQRYSRRIEDDRLPQSNEKRTAYAEMVGKDGFALIDLLQGVDAPEQWNQLGAVEALRLVLERHYERSCEDVSEGKQHHQVRLKTSGELPPAAEGIESPYDPEARFRSRHATTWTGYQVHLSETCEDDAVHLITHVETTQSTVHESQSNETRTAYAETVGEDGYTLLDLLLEPDAPGQSVQLPRVKALQLVLERHYERLFEEGSEGKQHHQVRFKTNGELPPAAEGIESPYDPEARFRSVS